MPLVSSIARSIGSNGVGVALPPFFFAPFFARLGMFFFAPFFCQRISEIGRVANKSRSKPSLLFPPFVVNTLVFPTSKPKNSKIMKISNIRPVRFFEV